MRIHDPRFVRLLHIRTWLPQTTSGISQACRSKLRSLEGNDGVVARSQCEQALFHDNIVTSTATTTYAILSSQGGRNNLVFSPVRCVVPQTGQARYAGSCAKALGLLGSRLKKEAAI